MNQQAPTNSLLPSSSFRNGGGAPYLAQRGQASNSLTRNSSLRQPPREAGTATNTASSRALAATTTSVSSLPPLIGANQTPSRPSSIHSPALSPTTPSPTQPTSHNRRFMQSMSSPTARASPLLSSSTSNIDHPSNAGPPFSALSISTPNPPTVASTTRLLRLDSLSLSPLSTTMSSRMMQGPISTLNSSLLPASRAQEASSVVASPSTPTLSTPTPVHVTQPPEPSEQPVTPPSAPPEDKVEVSPQLEALSSPVEPPTPSEPPPISSLASIPEDTPSLSPSLLQPLTSSSSDSLASSTSQYVDPDPPAPMTGWAVRVDYPPPSDAPGIIASGPREVGGVVDMQSVNGDDEEADFGEAGDSYNEGDDGEDPDLEDEEEDEEEEDDCFNPDDLTRRAFSDSHFHFTYSHPSMADHDLWSRYATGRDQEEEDDAMEVDEEDTAEGAGEEERISSGGYEMDPQYQAAPDQGSSSSDHYVTQNEGEMDMEGEGEDTFPAHGDSERGGERAPLHSTLETPMNLADSIPLQNWTQHAARMLLPHSMRDLADLLMGDGWRPGIADPLPSFPLPSAPAHASSFTAAQSAAGSGGASTSYGAPGQHNRGRSRIFSKLAKAQDEAALLADLAASTKVVPSSELLGGRQPQKHVKLVMSDAELVTQLLKELPGVDPNSAAVRVACAALAGKGVQARLLTSYN